MRPTREYFIEDYVSYYNAIIMDGNSGEHAISKVLGEIHNKYLSDQNSVGTKIFKVRDKRQGKYLDKILMMPDGTLWRTYREPMDAGVNTLELVKNMDDYIVEIITKSE